jgi:hypothetical protein
MEEFNFEVFIYRTDDTICMLKQLIYKGRISSELLEALEELIDLFKLKVRITFP